MLYYQMCLCVTLFIRGGIDMNDIHDVCDYIILKVSEAGAGLNNLKLQKLVYYCQAWHLAFYKSPLFYGKFQAWIHGPVSRELYDRFMSQKSLYSPIDNTDIRPRFNPLSLSYAARGHIDTILETYAQFSGSQLEDMTHEEDPWIYARNGTHPAQRCENEIDEGVMANYYSMRIR